MFPRLTPKTCLPTPKTCLLVAASVCLPATGVSGQEGCCFEPAYRLQCETVMQPQTVQRYRISYETEYVPQEVTSYRPVLKTRSETVSYTHLTLPTTPYV
jgi:hypothetical protein